jgi:hypothetical protein
MTMALVMAGDAGTLMVIIKIMGMDMAEVMMIN